MALADQKVPLSKKFTGMHEQHLIKWKDRVRRRKTK